jgi:hypothetical protein
VEPSSSVHFRRPRSAWWSGTEYIVMTPLLALDNWFYTHFLNLSLNVHTWLPSRF